MSSNYNRITSRISQVLTKISIRGRIFKINVIKIKQVKQVNKYIDKLSDIMIQILFLLCVIKRLKIKLTLYFTLTRIIVTRMSPHRR